MLKLLIVDDHAIFREGLRTLLDLEEDITVIGEANDGQEALRMLDDERPDIVLLDLHLPDALGSELCHRIRRLYPDVRVLILSAYEEDQEITAALVGGASGYVLKTTSGDRLAENLRAVARGEVLLAPSVAAKVAQQLNRLQEDARPDEDALHNLTPREREVFHLASLGLKNAEIAERLVLSDKTIKTHLRNIYNKMDLSGKAELRLYAVRMGLVNDTVPAGRR
jgi:two-component system NarL family response regulator